MSTDQLAQNNPPVSKLSRSESGGTEAAQRWLAILTDPRNIQWLFALGGTFVVVGVLIWLGSQKVFENPWVQAAALGAGTLSALIAGWLMFLFSRYRLGARALVILGSVLLPINPWFYLESGLAANLTHLWIAGLMATVIYAVVAYTFRESVFVYVSIVGATVTVLWALLEEAGVKEVTPDTLVYVLIACSLLYLAAERAFPSDAESPFSRQRFGMPFYWCAMAGITLALLITYGLGVAAWVADYFRAATVDVIDTSTTAVISFIGAGAYLYGGVVVRRKGIYVYLSAIALLGGEVALAALIRPSPETIMIAMAVTSLIATVIARYSELLARPMSLFSTLVSVAALMIALFLALSATSSLTIFAPREASWYLVLAVLVVGASCRTAAALLPSRHERLIVSHFFLWSISLVIAAAVLLRTLGLVTWETQAPFLALVPVGLLSAARAWHGKQPEDPLRWSAHTGLAFIILFVVINSIQNLERLIPVTGQPHNLLLALVFIIAAVYGVLYAAFWARGRGIYLATVMACGAAWQFVAYTEVPGPYYPIAFAIMGLVLLTYSAVGRSPRLVEPALVSGNALVGVSLIAAALLAVARLGVGSPELASTVWPLVFTTLASAVAAWTLRRVAVYRFYFVMMFIMGALTAFTIASVRELTGWQVMEGFLVLCGLVLIVQGLYGMGRETDRRKDHVTSCLWLGGLLCLVPLFVAMVYWRLTGHLSVVDEVALFFIAAAITTLGFFLRIKSATVIGGAILIGHVGVLVFTMRFWDLVPVGAYLMLGGIAIFGSALILSVKRDRIVEIPRRYRERQGFFKVLAWR
ncbi:MAG: hypothetical protein V3R81_14220 [Gammaproteobacteria bacterium]